MLEQIYTFRGTRGGEEVVVGQDVFPTLKGATRQARDWARAGLDVTVWRGDTLVHIEPAAPEPVADDGAAGVPWGEFAGNAVGAAFLPLAVPLFWPLLLVGSLIGRVVEWAGWGRVTEPIEAVLLGALPVFGALAGAVCWWLGWWPLALYAGLVATPLAAVSLWRDWRGWQRWEAEFKGEPGAATHASEGAGVPPEA